jgi:hypothetical protein
MVQWLAGVRSEGGMNSSAQRIFRVVKLLCIVLKGWMHFITHSSSPIGLRQTPRVNPDGNHGLWVTTMCHLGSSTGTNVPFVKLGVGGGTGNT